MSDNRYSNRQKWAKKHYERVERQGRPVQKKKNEERKLWERPDEDRGGSRSFYKKMAEDTVEMTKEYKVETKNYTEIIDIERTENYPEVEIWKCSTIEACEKLKGKRICVLNFASGKNPGGGFLKGSNAQEESICRVSGLYHCIKDNEMYAKNIKDNRNNCYHNMALYSSNVHVVKDEEGNLVDAYCIDVITSPAVNMTHAVKKVGIVIARKEMEKRVDLVLSVAATHEHDVLVLGSWGCGVFGGNLNDLCKMYHTGFQKYGGGLKKVVFAVLGEKDEEIFQEFWSQFTT